MRDFDDISVGASEFCLEMTQFPAAVTKQKAFEWNLIDQSWGLLCSV